LSYTVRKSLGEPQKGQPANGLGNALSERYRSGKAEVSCELRGWKLVPYFLEVPRLAIDLRLLGVRSGEPVVLVRAGQLRAERRLQAGWDGMLEPMIERIGNWKRLYVVYGSVLGPGETITRYTRQRVKLEIEIDGESREEFSPGDRLGIRDIEEAINAGWMVAARTN
jgi:hypothetical protein